MTDLALRKEEVDSYTNGVKGIVLAGGTGTRLHPITHAVSKQLLPIYDKPMIFYPLSTLMLSGLRDILLITTPHDQDAFTRLLGDGSQFGIRITYVVQDRPNGLAEALILGEKFLDGEKCALILGDNLFYGPGLGTHLQENTEVNGALIFAYQVSNPSAYGVVDFDETGTVLSIEEKPTAPKSNYAVPGIYFYDERAPEFAHQLTPSARGELEITALNNAYLERGELRVEVLSRATTWLDTGTHESLYEAGGLIRTLQHRTGMRIGDIEQIARDQGWI
jgi:glucose-1-phosphate thymidylyltransferase